MAPSDAYSVPPWRHSAGGGPVLTNCAVNLANALYRQFLQAVFRACFARSASTEMRSSSQSVGVVSLLLKTQLQASRSVRLRIAFGFSFDVISQADSIITKSTIPEKLHQHSLGPGHREH